MELSFKSFYQDTQEELYYEKFFQIFSKNNYEKDILIVNVHEKIILWMLERKTSDKMLVDSSIAEP